MFGSIFAQLPVHLVDHVLGLLLVVVSPVWDWLETRALKANPRSAPRLRYYQQTIVILAGALP